MECTHGIWEAHSQAVSTSEVKLFELYFTEGYYKAAFHRWTELLWHVSQAKLRSQGAIQGVVCHQDLTSKLLVTSLNVIVCHLPCAARTCKVLCPWALFHPSIYIVILFKCAIISRSTLQSLSHIRIIKSFLTLLLCQLLAPSSLFLFLSGSYHTGVYTCEIIGHTNVTIIKCTKFLLNL